MGQSFIACDREQALLLAPSVIGCRGARAGYVQHGLLPGSTTPTDCTQGFSQQVRGYRHLLATNACGRSSYRPRSIFIACGDGNYSLNGLRWRNWNHGSTRGRGTAHVNDCDRSAPQGTSTPTSCACAHSGRDAAAGTGPLPLRAPAHHLRRRTSARNQSDRRRAALLPASDVAAQRPTQRSTTIAAVGAYVLVLANPGPHTRSR
jgi:hypothetical protein